MAIAFVTAGSNNNAGNTAAVSLAASAANQTAVIFVRWNAGFNFSSLTVDGSSDGITQIGSEYTIFAGDTGRIYYLYNPPASSVSYSFSSTGPGDGVDILVSIYSGADNTQPDSSATSSTSNTSITLDTAVVAADCWLVGYCRGNATIAAGGGTTQRTKVGANMIGDSNGTVGTGSQGLGFTRDPSGLIGGAIISLAIDNGGGGGVVTSAQAGFINLLGVGN